MAGRPKNPDWTVEPWAPDLNYGLDGAPWSGTPTKVPWAGAASVGITPRTGFPAQAMNYALHAAYDQDQKAKDAIDALVDYVGQMPALNFLATQTGGNFSNLTWALENRKGRWYVFGTGKCLVGLRQNFSDWAILGNIFNSKASGEIVRGAAVDMAGNVVCSTDTKQVFYVEHVDVWPVTPSDVVTKIDAFGSAAHAGASSGVVFDPVSGFWVAVLYDIGGLGTGDLLVRRSSNGTTWASATAPSKPSGIGSHLRVACNRETGRVVAAVATAINDDQSRVSFFRSDDGGATWTASGSFTTTGFIIDELGFAHNKDTGQWLVTASKITGTTKGEVWSSTNGSTWTLETALSSSCVVGQPAPVGDMWVALAKIRPYAEGVVYSLDGGASWRDAGFWISGPHKGVFGGVGGLLAVSATEVYLSMRAGLPSLGLLI